RPDPARDAQRGRTAMGAAGDRRAARRAARSGGDRMGRPEAGNRDPPRRGAVPPPGRLTGTLAAVDQEASSRPDDEEEPGAGGPRGAIDSHCHLYLMDAEPAEAVAAANAAGVVRLVCVGIDPASSVRSLELAESFRGVFATAGMHPNESSGFDRAASAAIEQLLASPLVVGVGE